MVKSEFGMIVMSLAGHDRKKYYVIVSKDENFVYLVNGKSRTLENPKKKNRKHVQFTSKKAFDKYDVNGLHIQLTDELIKKKIKEYKNENQN